MSHEGAGIAGTFDSAPSTPSSPTVTFESPPPTLNPKLIDVSTLNTSHSPTDATSVDGVGEPKTSTTKRHSQYFWDLIKFRVEGVDFRLPKYRFVEESDIFAKEYGISEVDHDEDKPIELDVLLDDFEAFLKAFLPRESSMYDDKPTLSKDEWISVLKLSSQWLFNDLRKLAIEHLSGMEIGAIERICLANSYMVSEWLLEGYERIVERLTTFDMVFELEETTLTPEEAEKIGWEAALELSGRVIRRVREAAEAKIPIRSMREDISSTFSGTLRSMNGESMRYRTKKEVLEQEKRKREEEEAKAAAEAVALASQVAQLEAEAKRQREEKEREEERVALMTEEQKVDEELKRLEKRKRELAEQRDPGWPRTPTLNASFGAAWFSPTQTKVVTTGASTQNKVVTTGAPIHVGNYGPGFPTAQCWLPVAGGV